MVKPSLDKAWESFREQQMDAWDDYYHDEAYRRYADMACRPDGLQALRHEQERIYKEADGDLKEKARSFFERAYESDGVRLAESRDGGLVFEPDPLGSKGYEAARRAEEFLMKAIQAEAREYALHEIKCLRHTWGARALANDFLPILLEEEKEEEKQDEVAERTARYATKIQLQHLRTARDVLKADPTISTREDFEDACPDSGGPSENACRTWQKNDRFGCRREPSPPIPWLRRRISAARRRPMDRQAR
jgi:hypothetical protein